MPFPYDPANARVRVCTTISGTYTTVGKVRNAPLDEGQENRTKTKYLGGQVVRPGDNTLSGSVECLFDDGDTTGQEILKTAKRNGTSVFLQYCPFGTTVGLKVDQMEVNITKLGYSLNADDEIVPRTFEWEGVDDAPTTITLA